MAGHKDSHKVEGLYNISGEFIPSSPSSLLPFLNAIYNYTSVPN